MADSRDRGVGPSRREVLTAGSGATAMALAGCSSLLNPDEDAENGDQNGTENGDENGTQNGEDQSTFETEFDPSVFFLSWQRDPTTTMTVDWHVESDVDRDPVVEYRAADADGAWDTVTGETVYHVDDEFHPDDETDWNRTIHRAEITELDPATAYEFRFGTAPVWTFETLPASLDEPLTFANGGDSGHEGWDPILESMMEHDPAFMTICGDMPYANGGNASDSTAIWHSWFESVREYLVTDEGRVVPIVAGIGNHECRNFYFDLIPLNPQGSLTNIEHDEQGAIMNGTIEGDAQETRERLAPFFYNFFAFPGEPGYDILDVSDYLSIPMMDTYHTNPVVGEQTEWLDSKLENRSDVDHVMPHLHAPIFPSHREGDVRYTRHIQDQWVPMFERENIRISFGHHDHTTKLTPPLLDGEIDEAGLVEVGDGCLGRPPREVHPDREWIANATAENCVNIVTIDGETEYVETVGPDGSTLQDIEREVLA